MSNRQVFVVGLDAHNLAMLARVPGAADCDFHPALEISEMRGVEHWDIDALVDHAVERLAAAGRVDGVLSWWDFPGTLLVPILAERLGLPGPSIESVLKCEDKYWSRLEQRKVIPEHVPPFRAFDPSDADAFSKLELLPPFWVKPVKGYRSWLAYRVNDERHFREIATELRAGVGTIVEPFRKLERRFGAPPEIVGMRESCIAESPIEGVQCTLEGYAQNGRVVGYGIVDSIRELDRSSFARYEYPSALPLEIQHRLIDTARNAIAGIGLDNAPFNIEFFYDQTNDGLWLLEINPRSSQSHAALFEMVHGHAHFNIALDLCLGRQPPPMDRRGTHAVAAHFMLRTFEPGRVTRVPSAEEIAALGRHQSGTVVRLNVREGQHLRELASQDSYSFELATVSIGGRDRRELDDKYDYCLEHLTFEIAKDEGIQQLEHPPLAHGR